MTGAQAPIRRVEHCMGTVFSIDVREPGVTATVLHDAVALLHEIDARYSTYRDDSVISRLDRAEFSLADCDDEVRGVLSECDRWQRETGGWFSARAAGRLDPSGYVKGWAIARVSELLVSAGSRNHCVNGGGDVQTVGSSVGGRPWQVGVVDPRERGRVITRVAGVGIAVATSGVAERGAHIVDPTTGRPAAGALLSLTVSSHSIVECDVLATAGFAMGERAAEWLAGRVGVVAFGVRADGSTFSTGGRRRAEPGPAAVRW